MAQPFIKTNFAGGEIAPDLWGHVDLQKVASGAATVRNCYVGYRGGLYSRAGTALVGRCKQTPPAAPPRDIPFNFSQSQSYALEFGDNYMRVKIAGAYALNTAVSLTGASLANPCVISVGTLGVTAATPITTGVIASYAPGDDVTVAGGNFAFRAVLAVTNTKLVSIGVVLPGTSGSYAPADTITLSGGTQTTAPIVTVVTTKVIAATINAGGSGGTTGLATVTGTTGTGTLFQASVTISGGAITIIHSITTAGNYTVNPTDVTQEPVTGGGLSGAKLALTMGVRTVSITTAGVLTANPAGGNGFFRQSATSGSGLGATFAAVLGPNAVSVANGGAYNTAPPNPAPQFSTTGGGSGATFTLTTAPASALSEGDWVYFTGVGGMTQLNQNTYIATNVGPSSFAIQDLDGNNIDSTAFSAFTSGGTVASLFTLVTPYAAADLPYLKYGQDTDTMSLTCVNLATGAEYAPYELKRLGSNNWTITALSLGSTISAPAICTATASNNPDSGASPPTQPCAYAYVVTAVDLTTGQESTASPIANVTNTVDMGLAAGSITVSWSAVVGAGAYNVYRTAPAYNTKAGDTANALPVPAGAVFFFAGSAYGTQFVDTNIVTDSSKAPPSHTDPFARGSVPAITVTSSSVDWTTAAVSITSATGSGWTGEAVIVSNAIVAIITLTAGQNYTSADTLAVVGDGTIVTGTLTIGPSVGTYPAVVTYFQERRVYLQTLNRPDTLFSSQSEHFLDFDASNPPNATDAITASPFSQTVNGIQWAIPMPGGLVMLTGSGAWQWAGVGSSPVSVQPVTPASQQAQPQAFNGADPVCPPVRVNYDIIFLSSSGQFFYDLSYNFYFNVYNVDDISWPAGHLFLGHDFSQTALCLQPFKLIWVLRSDGVLLSLTWLKEQQVAGWGRHDTQGIVKSICAIPEPPVDALYLIVERYVQNRWLYFSERMDNRIWESGEKCWAVDCGLSTLTATAQPNATLSPSAGQGNRVLCTASAPVFSAGNINQILRCGGGIGTIANFVDAQNVRVNWTRPMTTVLPGDPRGTPIPAPAGTWSILPQVTTISNLGHLAGSQVVGLADGIPIGISPSLKSRYPWLPAASFGLLQVSAAGSVILPFAASLVTIGLSMVPQVQSLYLDADQPTEQGRRKNINAVSVRTTASGWPSAAANEVDGSALDPVRVAPVWTGLSGLRPSPAGAQTQANYTNASGQSVTPLFTGDLRVNIGSTWRKQGQVAIQQDLPLPMNITALMPEYLDGDLPDVGIKQRPARNVGGGDQGQTQAAVVGGSRGATPLPPGLRLP